MSIALARTRPLFVLATVAVMIAGCAKATQSQLLPANGARAAVRFHKSSVVENVIYNFAGGSGSMGDGASPHAGLISVSDTLYGTTAEGGDYGHKKDRFGFGTVFSLTPYGTETVLHRFVGPDGRYPYADLIDIDDTLYGTTLSGGTGKGTVFSITPYGAENVLYSFKRGIGDGAGPEAGLIDVNGTLYGTTPGGGKHQRGTVFSITPSGKETVIHSFGGKGDGSAPLAGLVNVNGTLYGTTIYGNAPGVYGTVYAITPSGKETVLHGFKGATGDGAEPWAGLINVNGTLYGTTFVGGAYGNCNGVGGCGTVFSITPSGKETVVYSFKGGTSDGDEPEASLLSVDSILYGTTYGGGEHGHGIVFSIATAGADTVIHSFGASGDGEAPEAGLIDVNGTLYGTTTGGGAHGLGTVYSLTGF